MKMNIYKIAKRLYFAVINLITLIISFLIPKTDKIIVVGGWFGERFADNSKYFYLYVNENKEKLKIDKIVWITRSDEILEELRTQDYVSYKTWSFLSIWYHLRAKIHVVDQSCDDINSFFSIRSKRVNLWHGFPLKKIGTYQDSQKNTGLFSEKKLFKLIYDYSIPGGWGKYYLLATSKFSAEILGEAFDCSKDEIIISGYPRNYEAIIKEPIQYITESEKSFSEQIKNRRINGSKIIGYFPTFRDKRETLIFGVNNSEELKDLLDYFEKERITIVGKFHFAGKSDKFLSVHNHQAFINLPSDADVYSFLNQIDIVMTDYSSIYFDYLLWRKPIIFFPYDLEYYRDEDRGFIFDYNTFTPGPKIFNIAELKELLVDEGNIFTENYTIQYGKEALELEKSIFGNTIDRDIKHLIKQIRSIKR